MQRRLLIASLALVALWGTRGLWLPNHRMSAQEVAAVRASTPEQTPLTDPEPIRWKKSGSTVTLEPLYGYHVLARVMGVERYRFGREARYSPVDVLLAWGPVADPAHDGSLTWSQSGRFGFYRYRELPAELTPAMLRTMSANTHLVPVDAYIESRIKKIRRGDVVEIWGSLVALREDWDDGAWFQWASSTTRKDRGAGACELVLVEDLRINGR